jgi:hypothetical protein
MFYREWAVVVEIERHPGLARRLHEAERALMSEHCHFDGVFFRASAHPETALVPDGQQFAERIVRGVTRFATLVDPVNHQIGAIQLIKADDLLIRAHAMQPQYHTTHASPYRATVTGCVWQRCQTQRCDVGGPWR